MDRKAELQKMVLADTTLSRFLLYLNPSVQMREHKACVVQLNAPLSFRDFYRKNLKMMLYKSGCRVFEAMMNAYEESEEVHEGVPEGVPEYLHITSDEMWDNFLLQTAVPIGVEWSLLGNMVSDLEIIWTDDEEINEKGLEELPKCDLSNKDEVKSLLENKAKKFPFKVDKFYMLRQYVKESKEEGVFYYIHIPKSAWKC